MVNHGPSSLERWSRIRRGQYVVAIVSVPTLLLSLMPHSTLADECQLFLAPSTIPGSGLGIFAGSKGFQSGDPVSSGDVVVPLFYLFWHNGYAPEGNQPGTFHFLWNQYSWDIDSFPGMEEEVDPVDIEYLDGASPGFGAAINCDIPLVNVNEDKVAPKISNAGLPATSPGLGAFTPYHGRTFHATYSIPAGMELFLSYGDDYFRSRPNEYGPAMPFDEHYTTADKILKKFRNLKRNTFNQTNHQTRTENIALVGNQTESAFSGLWALLQDLKSTWHSEPTMRVIPKDEALLDQVLDTGGTSKMNYNRSIRSMDWLKAKGKCMDNIKDGISNIPHAGRGAFARRPISKGSIIAPAPIIHIPQRNTLTIYQEQERLTEDMLHVRNISAPVHSQLLLNYCFGHGQSTLLLCPYGLLTWLINHSSHKPNAEIQWSNEMRHSEWRNKSIEEWAFTWHAGLSVDYVALRDIEEGEEIVIDYGKEWEDAWSEHVRNFPSIAAGRKEYIPAFELNEMDVELRTIADRPYEQDNVRLKCRLEYLVVAGIPGDWSDQNYRCKILQKRRRSNDIHDTSYTAQLLWPTENEFGCYIEEGPILWDVPRDAIFFEDMPFARDHNQLWAFRHAMMFPDSLFPDLWRNFNLAMEHKSPGGSPIPNPPGPRVANWVF